jgi:hypothetical protein
MKSIIAFAVGMLVLILAGTYCLVEMFLNI